MYQFVDLSDEWYDAGAFAFRSFVDQSAWCGGCLASDGPGPFRGVDVFDAAAGHLADPRGRARSEDNDITPDSVVAVSVRDQCVSEAG